MCIKNIFKKIKIEEPPPKKLNTIKDLDYLSSVWVKDGDEIYSGWVFDISRRHITVVYGEELFDYRFRIQKPASLTEVEQDNKILYCNEPSKLSKSI